MSATYSSYKQLTPTMLKNGFYGLMTAIRIAFLAVMYSRTSTTNSKVAAIGIPYQNIFAVIAPLILVALRITPCNPSTSAKEFGQLTRASRRLMLGLSFLSVALYIGFAKLESGSNEYQEHYSYFAYGGAFFIFSNFVNFWAQSFLRTAEKKLQQNDNTQITSPVYRNLQPENFLLFTNILHTLISVMCVTGLYKAQDKLPSPWLSFAFGTSDTLATLCEIAAIGYYCAKSKIGTDALVNYFDLNKKIDNIKTYYPKLKALVTQSTVIALQASAIYVSQFFLARAARSISIASLLACNILLQMGTIFGDVGFQASLSASSVNRDHPGNTAPHKFRRKMHKDLRASAVITGAMNLILWAMLYIFRSNISDFFIPHDAAIETTQAIHEEVNSLIFLPTLIGIMLCETLNFAYGALMRGGLDKQDDKWHKNTVNQDAAATVLSCSLAVAGFYIAKHVTSPTIETLFWIRVASFALNAIILAKCTHSRIGVCTTVRNATVEDEARATAPLLDGQ